MGKMGNPMRRTRHETGKEFYTGYPVATSDGYVGVIVDTRIFHGNKEFLVRIDGTGERKYYSPTEMKALAAPWSSPRLQCQLLDAKIDELRKEIAELEEIKKALEERMEQ